MHLFKVLLIFLHMNRILAILLEHVQTRFSTADNASNPLRVAFRLCVAPFRQRLFPPEFFHVQWVVSKFFR